MLTILLPASTSFVSFLNNFLAEKACSDPTVLSRLKYHDFSRGHTDPNSISGIYSFNYFWKAFLKSRKFPHDTSWAVAAEPAF